MDASYFDYEKISEHLPADGEAIIIFRKDGELGVRDCPFLPEDLITDHDSMGRLLIANEKISKVTTHLFILAVLIVLLSIGALWNFQDLGWSYWWLHLSIFFAVIALQSWWTSARQRRIFRRQVLGTLQTVRRSQALSDPAFLAILKQISDLQPLAQSYQQYLAAVDEEPSETSTR